MYVHICTCIYILSSNSNKPDLICDNALLVHRNNTLVLYWIYFIMVSLKSERCYIACFITGEVAQQWVEKNPSSSRIQDVEQCAKASIGIFLLHFIYFSINVDYMFVLAKLVL